MTDVGFALEAKSDQLNAVDIMAAERIIKIRDVKVKKGEQPVWIYFDGDNNRPWKPSKGMLRILAGAWSQDSQNWIGKSAQLYFCPEVVYAGKPVGGIRIRSLSDIDPRGLSFALTINRSRRDQYLVPLLVLNTTPYPTERFDAAFPTMVEKMRSGEMSLQEIIAQCQKTGALSGEQLKRLENEAPVETDCDDDNIEIIEQEQNQCPEESTKSF